MLFWLSQPILSSSQRQSQRQVDGPWASSFFSIRATKRWVVGLLLIAVVIGCGGLQACGSPSGTPLIRQFAYTGQDPNRRTIFYFKLVWEDADGNLASPEKNARVVLKIENPDDLKQQPIEFAIEFRVGQIPEGTLSGTIPNDKISSVQLTADIREEDPSKAYPQRIKVTATLYDSAGNASNQPWIILQKDNTN